MEARMGRYSIRSTGWLTCLLAGITLTAPNFADELNNKLPGITATQQPAQTVAPLSLPDLEKMALYRNPTLAQAAAQVGASHGKALQAGLYPNPVVGYTSDQIGAEGKA